MRELHVVEVSEDGRHVLLAGKRGATKGGFRVALDDRLLAAVRGDLPRPGEDPFAAPDLSPKEIQARLRAGESAASIAQSAGVPVLRVERFSGPVQGEMARMIDATRSAHLVRGRLGRSVLPLGPAVDHALAQGASVPPETTWETFREEDGRWLVTVTWYARARTRTASWRYHPPSKTVTATDPLSAALAHHDPDAVEAPAKRRTAPASPKKATARKAPAKKAPANQAPANKAAAKKAAAKKAAAKKAPAQRGTAKAAPVKEAPAKKAPAKKAPAKRIAAKKPPAKTAPARHAVASRAPAKKAPAKKMSAKKAPGARPARALRVVPDPPPTKGRTAADRDGVKTRTSVPGWADVLLGTSPGGDR